MSKTLFETLVANVESAAHIRSTWYDYGTRRYEFYFDLPNYRRIVFDAWVYANSINIEVCKIADVAREGHKPYDVNSWSVRIENKRGAIKMKRYIEDMARNWFDAPEGVSIDDRGPMVFIDRAVKSRAEIPAEIAGKTALAA